MVQLGMGCAFLAICWIGGQLCAKGFQITRKSKDSPELIRYWSDPWNRRPVLGREQGKRGLKDRWELDDSGQHELDPGEEREIWVEVSPERVVALSREIKKDIKVTGTDLTGPESQL